MRLLLSLWCCLAILAMVLEHPRRSERNQSRLSLSGDPTKEAAAAFRIACKSGNTEWAQQLVQAIPQLNIREYDDFALRMAAEHGHLAVVTWLLEMGASAKASSNYALRKASENGHEAIVALLLQQHGVRPEARRMDTLYLASYNGHSGVVQLLLEHTNSPCLGLIGDIGVENAIRGNNFGVFKAFLDDGRVDVIQLGHFFLRLASILGRHKMVKLLLADPRVHPDCLHYSSPVTLAAAQGHAKTVMVLLAAGFDSTSGTDLALRRAIKAGHQEVCQVLLEDQRLHPSSKLNKALSQIQHVYPDIFIMFNEYYLVQKDLKALSRRPSGKAILERGKRKLLSPRSAKSNTLQSPFHRSKAEEGHISLDHSKSESELSLETAF